MKEDKIRVERLLKKFRPNILRLAVYFISYDARLQELKNYLAEHKDFHPDQRELLHTLITLTGEDVNELVVLSRNIVNNQYDMNEIIPL